MSEKVVLTHKEIGGVKAAIESCNGDRGRVLKHHGMPNQTWQNSCAPLREMPFDKLARVLFIGYEVEKPNFKKGDLVTNTYSKQFCTGNKICMVTDVTDKALEDTYSVGLSNGLYYVEDSLRHATAEEVFWLHELGRDSIGDFREGDVIITQEVSYRYSTDGEVDTIGPHTTQLWLEEGIIKGIYPAESFKPFKKEQTK